ncbi:MAG: alpha/beta hydrolase [Flavisolibacter sp.]|jgi:S-formylglutathione hydrolase FrmB
MHKYFFAFLFVTISKFSLAGKVDTVSIYSNAMHRSFRCVIVTPDTYKNKTAFPVVYLLHGHGGGYDDWIKQVPKIADYADQYQTIIVCPDGAVSSWYFDSPLDSTMEFETYIAKEVPTYVDAHLHTIANRNARAITGLSMGGHGGLFLGFRHANFFGACGSMSGGVDLRPFPKKWNISTRIGDSSSYPENWKNYSVITIVEQKPADSLAIIFDCGTEDFFYKVNHSLHEKMLRLKIPHDYIERPGKHDWNYWANAVQYQLLYFRNYFDRKLKKS